MFQYFIEQLALPNQEGSICSGILAERGRTPYNLLVRWGSIISCYNRIKVFMVNAIFFLYFRYTIKEIFIFVLFCNKPKITHYEYNWQ